MTDSTVSIGNAQVMATISLHGAELIEFCGPDKKNAMWTRNEVFWNRVAPNLFPIVGRLKDDKYTINGEEYAMRQHGFARDFGFDVLDQSETEVSMILKSNSETQMVYPFEFEFVVRYRLEENTLWVDYQTKNVGEVEMLYSVGGHPGFALDGALDLHSLQFGKEGEWVSFTADRECIATGYYNGRIETITVDGVLPLSDALFLEDAIVWKAPDFDTIRLLGEDGKVLLNFYCWEWDAVGLWTKPGAPFFCIEPWWGWADSIDSTGNFRHKPGLHKLRSGEEETVSYGIGLPA